MVVMAARAALVQLALMELLVPVLIRNIWIPRLPRVPTRLLDRLMKTDIMVKLGPLAVLLRLA